MSSLQAAEVREKVETPGGLRNMLRLNLSQGVLSRYILFPTVFTVPAFF